MPLQPFSRPFLVALLLAGTVPAVRAQVQGQPQRETPAGAWSLQKCIDYALANNLQVKQSQNTSEFSRLTYNRSRGNLLPAINGSGSHGYSYGRSIDPFTNQFVDQRIQTNNFSISANQVLFAGLQRQNTIKQNQLEQEAARLDVQTAQNNVVLQVVTAYLQVLFADELVQSSTLVFNNTQEQLNRSERLVKAGALAESALLDLRAQLASDELNIITAQNQRELARLTLVQLLNLPTSENFNVLKPEVGDPVSQPLTQTSEAIYTAAEQNLPQIKSTQVRLSSALRGVAVARGGYYPSLSLSGNIYSLYSSARKDRISFQQTVVQQQIGYVNGSTPDDPPIPVYSNVPVSIPVTQNYPFFDQLRDNVSKSFGFNLTVPILNGFTVRNSVQRALINQRNAELNAQIAKNQLRQDVEKAYTDARAAEKKFLAAQRQYAAFEASYNNAQLRLSKGAINSTDFNVSKNNFTKAQSDLIQAKFDYLFKLKVLDFYQGKPLTL